MTDATAVPEQKPEAAEPQAGPQAGGAPAPATFRTILGQKVGMTQLFDKDGKLVPVTVVQAGPCPVVRIASKDKNGYEAVQIGFGAVNERNVLSPVAGQFKKSGVSPMRWLREFRTPVAGFELGQIVTAATRFKADDYVDVRGVTKGKGFAGAVKRHGFRGGPASHGQSDRERAPGSLTSRRSLGKVLSGQRGAGRMGHEWNTVVKLMVYEIDAEQNLLYVRGGVPGVNRGLLLITETTRTQKRYVPPKKRAVMKTKMGQKIAAPAAKAKPAAAPAKK